MSEINESELDEMMSGVDVPVPVPLKPDSLLARYETMSDTTDVFLASTGLKAERTVPDISKPWMKHHDFVLVQTPEQVEAIVDEAIRDGHVALDLETEGLDNRIYFNAQGKPETVHKIVGYCLSIGDAKIGYYIPIRHTPSDGGPDLNVRPLERVDAAISKLCHAAQPVLKSDTTDPLSDPAVLKPPQVVIDFWHASFDQEFLYPVTGIDWWHPESFEDGHLAAWVAYTSDKNLSLKDKAKELLQDKEGNPYEMIKLPELFPGQRRRNLNFSTLAPDEPGVIRYACSDAVCTRKLGFFYSPQMKQEKFAFAYRLEKQTAQAKRTMERNRCFINRDKAKVFYEAALLKREEIRVRILALAASKGFNNFEPGSPKQLGDFLFSAEGLDITPKPELNKASEQYKTDAGTLEELTKGMGDNAPEVLKWILEYREQDKLLGTYLEALCQNGDKNGEFRFSFKQTGAATGRFAAPQNEPEQGYAGFPIHGMPAGAGFRELFEARAGYLMVKCDYAGEELRIVTNLSNEPVWIKEFTEGDGDLHSITARAFFGKQDVTKEERKMGKVANFALVYGGGPASIVRATGCERPEAQRRKAAFDKALPTFAKWVKNQHAKVKQELGVYTAFGRWIAIPDANVRPGHKDDKGKVLSTEEANEIRAACERHATNYPIQGAGADIMKIAMVLIHKACYVRGWLRSGGDDSVRMLLTVHDELVFEIAYHRVLEALDVITECMERPTFMPRPKHSPPWLVPLITEPLIGKTWGAETGAHRYKRGENLEGLVHLGNWVFKKIPDWLEELLRNPPAPEGGSNGSGSGGPGPSMPYIPIVPPPPIVRETLQVAPTQQAVIPAAPATPPLQSATVHQKDEAPLVQEQVVTIRLNVLSRHSLTQVMEFCIKNINAEGPKLRLVHGLSDAVLIDPNLNVRVKPEDLAETFFRHNLSDGKYALS